MTATMEVTLDVCGYLYDGCDRDDAFALAAGDDEQACALAEFDLSDAGLDVTILKVDFVEFVEFDSSDISHAGAIFVVKVRGIRQADLDKALGL